MLTVVVVVTDSVVARSTGVSSGYQKFNYGDTKDGNNGNTIMSITTENESQTLETFLSIFYNHLCKLAVHLAQ